MFLTINELSKELNVSKSTLRRWEKEGKIKSERTIGGHRRYLKKDVKTESNDNKNVIAYARVSTHSQKYDLERQKQLLELYCTKNGYRYTIISDLGSGLNYKKKGLLELLNLIEDNKVSKIVLTHKDRLLRFGSEIIFYICGLKNIDVEIINNTDNKDDEKEFVKDVLEIITVFSSKLYGKRSNKNKKIIEQNKELFKIDNA